jgi:hypothetical protein
MEDKDLKSEEILSSQGLKREKTLDGLIDNLNRDFIKKIGPTMSSVYLIMDIIKATALNDRKILLYVRKIKSPFCFNSSLACIIENLVEQNKIGRAKEYAKLYRLDGLTELRQMHLFRVRYYAGFNFDWFLRQCVYLECINKGVETDEDFQMLFNRRFAKPNIPFRKLPRPLTIENIVEKMKTITDN